MRTNVLAGNQPWTASYNNMSADPRSSATYVMAGPFTYFTRDHSGDQTNLLAIIEDGRAAINLALRWYITNETAFAFASANILNRWASTLTLINGKYYFILPKSYDMLIPHSRIRCSAWCKSVWRESCQCG
jgi:hypothetical protein